jgi:hypothetical protein
MKLIFKLIQRHNSETVGLRKRVRFWYKSFFLRHALISSDRMIRDWVLHS